jgi:flagellar motor switch/type III secretory pathway protein FliN
MSAAEALISPEIQDRDILEKIQDDGLVSAERRETQDDGLNVDRIPVRLGFDLGEHKMTLGDLRRLRPGEFFDLQRRIDAGPLHIRANGTLIGTAELVDIEGRVGARVLTLTLDRHS